MIEQAIVTGLTDGAGYALIGIGLVLAYRVSGVVNIAQGEFVVMAILMAHTFAPKLGIGGAIVATVILVAGLGAAIERLVIRRVVDAPPLSGYLVTTGLAFALAGFMRLVWGPDEFTLAPFAGAESFGLLGAFVRPHAVVLIAAAAVITFVLGRTLSRTHVGKTALACSIDSTGARLSGVPVDAFRTGTWALTAALGAVAGILLGPLTFVTFDGGLPLMLRGLVAGSLAGMRSVPGAAAGGLVLGMCETLASTYVSSQLKTPVAFTVLFVILLTRSFSFSSAAAR